MDLTRDTNGLFFACSSIYGTNVTFQTHAGRLIRDPHLLYAFRTRAERDAWIAASPVHGSGPGSRRLARAPRGADAAHVANAALARADEEAVLAR